MPSQGPNEKIGDLKIQAKGLRYKAAVLLETAVVGPRGQQLTVASAQDRGAAVASAIDTEEAMGSQRHRSIGWMTKLLTLAFVVVFDYPIMLWLTSSVFNVDWSSPLGLPLAVSAVVSLLATGGAASALYHIGHDQRQNKDHHGHLDGSAMTRTSKVVLGGVAVLAVLIAGVAFVRVYVEGVLSGAEDLALLLAVLVAIVMLISASLLFWIAFRDGSPERDDLIYYTRLVRPYLRRKRFYDDEATRLEHQLELMTGRAASVRALDYDPANPAAANEAMPTEGCASTYAEEPRPPGSWRALDSRSNSDSSPPSHPPAA